MKFTNWLKSRNFKAILILLCLGIFLPNLTFADAISQLIGEVIFKVVMGPFIIALEIEMWILPVIARYNGFTSDLGIVQGWTVLRDLSNMFFILVLLIISFATIIGVKSYGYKQLLSRLIIVAILINFSRTIIGIVIDFSQIVMLTFLQAIQNVFHGGIFVALGLSKIMNMSKDSTLDLGTVVVALILGGIMLAIAVIVIGIIIAMLVMRIIKIWIAVVLAPLAFLAYILPKTQGYFNKWVSTLSKELTTGPVLLFFLWLALTIVGNGDVNKKFIKGEDGQAAIEEVSKAITPANLINYAIGIALLIGGLQAAAASGAMGASLAGSAASGINSFAARKARGLAGRTAAGLGRAVTDDEGNMRGGRLGTWIRRTPMYGGLIQRTAIKAQGYDAQRRIKDREDSLKYVQDKHKRAYSASLSSSYYQPKDFKKVQYETKDKNGKVVKKADWFKVNKVGQFVDKTGQVLKDQTDINARVKHKPQQKLWEPTYAVGRALKRIGSLGESSDHDQAEALAVFDRNEVNSDNAEWVTRQLRNAGQEEKMQAVQGKFWTFSGGEAGKAEAMRILRNKGLTGMLSDVHSDALFEDVNDLTSLKAGAKAALKAIADPEHGNADHNAINAAIGKNNKMDRWRISDAIAHNFTELYGQDLGEVSAVFLDQNGSAEINKRGGFDPNIDSNPAVIMAQSVAKLYNQKLQDGFDEETGKVSRVGMGSFVYAKMKHDLRKGSITPGQVGSSAPRMYGESNKEYKQRLAWLSELDGIKMTDPETLPQYLKEGKHAGKYLNADGSVNRKATERYRQRMYRQLLGELRPGEKPEDRKGNEILDTKDPRYIFDNDALKTNRARATAYVMMSNIPGMKRTDIVSQANTFAKETPEGAAARQAAYSKYGVKEEDQKRMERMIKHVTGVLDTDLSEVAPEIANIFGDAAKTAEKDIKLNMMASLAGDKRNSHDMISSSFWTEAMDGAHGSRIMEANVNDPMQRIQFEKALYSSETQQQGQAFAVGTGQQNRAMAEAIVDFGMQPQKQLVENLPKSVAAKVMQKLADVIAMRRGDLPQDLTMLGYDVKKLVTVLRGKSQEEGFGGDIAKLLAEKDEDGSIRETLENFNKIFKPGKDKNGNDRMGAIIDITNNTYTEGNKTKTFDEWLEEWDMGYKMHQPLPEEKSSDKSKAKPENATADAVKIAKAAAEGAVRGAAKDSGGSGGGVERLMNKKRGK